jgi:hypothetical protein
MDCQFRSIAQNDRALDNVGKLADIPGQAYAMSFSRASSVTAGKVLFCLTRESL